MTFHTKVGGAWKPAQVWTKVSGVWKTCLVWTKVSGAWKNASESARVDSTSVNAGSVSPATATAGIKFDSDGSVYEFINSGYGSAEYAWRTGSSSSADYEIQATPTGGTDLTPDGSAINTWLSLSTDRAWDIDSAGIGVEVTCDLLIEIRGATSHIVLDSGTVSLSALKDI